MVNSAHNVPFSYSYIIPELEDVIKHFNEIKKGITSKTYDYLDHRNQEFDNDYEELIANTNALKERIANTIEENYSGIWETLQGVKFLNRFEKVSFDHFLQLHNIISVCSRMSKHTSPLTNKYAELL